MYQREKAGATIRDRGAAATAPGAAVADKGTAVAKGKCIFARAEGRAKEMIAIEVKEELEQRELLKRYLEQYRRQLKKKDILRRRLENIRLELLGTKGTRYSITPKSQTNAIGNEPLDFVIKCQDIEERMEAQRKNAMACMLKVLDVLDFLDNGSLEKEIMEYKYLDGKTWDAIPDIANKSRSQCIEYWNRGLNKLLEFGKVQALLEEYKKMQENEKPDSTGQ